MLVRMRNGGQGPTYTTGGNVISRITMEISTEVPQNTKKMDLPYDSGHTSERNVYQHTIKIPAHVYF
jgi:hypothetical protein